MISPLEEYRYLRNIDNIWDLAYYNIFEKYILFRLRGPDKKIEIDSTDQESLLLEMNGGFPIPGMIYTFIYKGEDVNIKLQNRDKSYTDFVPLVFCINIGSRGFSGINLNILPENSRVKFLESFYRTFKDFLEREAASLAQNDKLALNKRFITFCKAGKGKEILEYFNRANRENFNFAYRTYYIGRLERLRMIEYSEWKYIPFYRPIEAFKKLSMEEIHGIYNRTRRDL